MQILYDEIRYSHRLIAWRSPDLYAFFLTQWEKVRLNFPRDLAFNLPVAKDFVNNFFVTWVHKEFADLL